MNVHRVVAIVAALTALALLAAIPGAFFGYRLASAAADWETAFGQITDRMNVTLPSFSCFVRDTRYSLIEYRYVASDGKTNVGNAQAPLDPSLYPGASIEIKFNPRNPAQSLPVVSISGYRAAHRGTLLVALPFAFGFLYTARRLWRSGAIRGRTVNGIETSAG